MLARIMHELPAATVDMAFLPGDRTWFEGEHGGYRLLSGEVPPHRRQVPDESADKCELRLAKVRPGRRLLPEVHRYSAGM
jgi:hypothetical protein